MTLPSAVHWCETVSPYRKNTRLRASENNVLMRISGPSKGSNARMDKLPDQIRSHKTKWMKHVARAGKTT